ncbi:MAG: HDOD domain-containing protein [Candidatus Manganitrophus sp. SA1]|nr:HDOD domain-containing protein [Candidatus Manganitrophus morganii]
MPTDFPVQYGKYLLIDKIAKGGMAEVFLAKQTGSKGFERLLAIKRILPHFTENAEFVSMFINEAKVAAQLSHPNIVQVFDFGQVEESYYIGMEYVMGRDLRTIMERSQKSNRPLPIDQILFIVSRVCSGLEHAHKKKDLHGNELNLVHRDISPQNILISYDGEIKLVDFGIAKAALQENETRTGTLKGKFAYMSPEQAWGKKVDHRSDLFSLGIVLYECATGKRLFKGDSEINTLDRVREAKFDPPRRFNADISEQIETVMSKSLVKEAGNRYPSAAQMQRELERCLSKPLSEVQAGLAQNLHQLFNEEIEKDRVRMKKAALATSEKSKIQGRAQTPPSGPSKSAPPSKPTPEAPKAEFKSTAQPTILQKLQDRIQHRGDLPVLRDTVIQTLRAAEDKVSGAADVARSILQDQGFAVKVLKVANSAYFNGGYGEVFTVSRAVVVLGLDMIRSVSLGLSFVELFQKQHPGIDLKKIIADAFIAATLAKELGERLHYPKQEELFLATLFYNLGPISLAYYLPESHLEIQRLVEKSGLPLWKAEQQVLGASVNQLGIAMAKECKVPDHLAEPLAASDQILFSPAHTPREQLWAVSYLANRIVGNLFTEKGTEEEMAGLMQQMEVCLKIPPEEGLGLIQKAYKNIKEVSDSFEIEAEKFRPPVTSGSKTSSPRSGLLERLGKIFRVSEGAEEEVPIPPVQIKESTNETEKIEAPEKIEGIDRPSLQLKFLRDISNHIAENQDINVLFSAILEGIHIGIGFDRALLVLCNPSKTQITGRYGLGALSQELADRLSLPNDPADNIFGKVYLEKKAVFVQDIHVEPIRPLISKSFLSLFESQSFVISPIHAKGNVIGFFYADKALSKEVISQEDYQLFLHFAFHANIALERMFLRSTS